MTEQHKQQGQQETRRVPNGHGYCWAAHSSGARCTQPKGHPGRHLDPYTPSVSW